MTTLDGAVVLVTGANGGLGREFVAQALARGAAKVYATARTPGHWEDERIVPLVLDVTSRDSTRAAAAEAQDVTVLINNAGAWTDASLLDDDLTAARAQFETNFWGQLEVSNAFLSALKKHRGGMVNVLSALSWLALADTYSTTKAALWSATNVQRVGLVEDGVQVVGLHLGYTDTGMTEGVEVEKNDPADVVSAAYDGLEAGEHEVLADEASRQVKAGLAAPLSALYPQLG
ncbi:SDR family oxidoreductase [Zhihengliuella halotolerans]|uniref:Short-subunit dehydrogenase n=1 Tax=Zhihengliuella halotolerans TaxID=370736 RepID=A0A4Q8AFH0_9MICC|nr:SDR family oxidoreductase [Zhihengliuella halotolerans]RZU63060.1 short-subunit dehydrogenase [Zhihengliuella halotolerans]